MASEQHPISLIYRLCFNYFEPFMAITGAAQVLTVPQNYLSIALPNQRYDPSMRPIFTEVTSGWFILAFHDLVTLRLYSRNVPIWRLVIAGNLISDIVYTYSIYQDLGAARFFNPALWTGYDWLTVVTTLVPLVLKVAFLGGLGVRSNLSKGEKSR